MIFFAAYALAVWFAAAKWRRRWWAFASVALGMVGLALVAYLHICLNEWTGGKIYLRVMQVFLYPYALLVGVVGIYISCLPRRIAEGACARCEYDLAGLAGESPACPECGVPVTPAAPATPSPRAAPLPAAPRWPATAAPVVCHHSAGG